MIHDHVECIILGLNALLLLICDDCSEGRGIMDTLAVTLASRIANHIQDDSG